MKHPPEVNRTEHEVAAARDAQLVDAFAGLDAQADQAVVQRTRRAVMAAAVQMGNAEIRHRRQVGIVLLAFVGLVVLLTPAIWSVADDLFSGEHFQDMPAMTMSLIVTLFSAIFAALIVHWRGRRTQDHEKF
jgi:hypothetical protein